VSVFETNIRVLGSLLSTHMLLRNPQLRFGKMLPNYNDQLLSLAVDLTRRLLPAFNTSTGIPYGTVNIDICVIVVVCMSWC
jgi:hypothetical protein